MAKHRRYKDPDLQAVYDYLRKLGTPEAVLASRTYGVTYHNFKNGYEGKPQFRGNSRGSIASVAYYAGVDAAEKKP